MFLIVLLPAGPILLVREVDLHVGLILFRCEGPDTLILTLLCTIILISLIDNQVRLIHDRQQRLSHQPDSYCLQNKFSVPVLPRNTGHRMKSLRV